MTAAHEPPDPEWREAGARFRFAGIVTLLMCLVGWAAWFYPFDDLLDRSATPLGGDYVMLYVAGQTLASGQSESLYDDLQNQRRSAALFPTMDPLESWPYRYPPTVAVCMIPLAQLPFAWSFAVFFSIQLAFFATALLLLRRDFSCLRENPIWLWAMAGSPLVVETLVGGQSSLIALLALLGFVHYFAKRQDAWAGAILALSLYKPNVLALFIVGCLIVRPRLLLGFVPTAIVGVAVAVGSCGWSGLVDYLRLGTQLASSSWSLETPFWKVHGLAPYLQMLAPEFGKLMSFGIGTALTLLVGFAARRQVLRVNSWMCLLLCINSLFNPYVPCYDLVLLMAALVFGTEAACREEWPSIGPKFFQGLVAVWFLGPHLSQSLAKLTGWQVFPFAIVLTLLVYWTVTRRRERPAWLSAWPADRPCSGHA